MEPVPNDLMEPALPSRTTEAQALAEALQRPLPRRGDGLAVASFNMLLRAFDRKAYYPSVPPELRAWPGRKAQLKALLLGMGADVYLMQEVECSSFREEFPFLEGYGAAAPKDDSKGKTPGLAKCCVLFREELLELLWEEHRSRVVLCALRHRATGRLIYVASAHLEGAPWEGATRLKQLRNALDSLQRRMRVDGVAPDECSLIFAGDFNEGPDGAVCASLRSGEEVEGTCRHPFKLSDAYGAGGAFGLERPPSFCAPADPDVGPAAFAAVDFLFYTAATLRLAAVRRPFTEAQARATEGLGVPSQWHFSDHVPLGGSFALEAGSGAAEIV